VEVNMVINAAEVKGKVPILLHIVVDLTVDEDLWNEKLSEGRKEIDIMKEVERGMRMNAPSPCWDSEIQYMKPVYEDDEDNEEHDRIVKARLDEIIEETKALAEITKLPKDSGLRAAKTAQVAAWRNENREHYNSYMREWQQKNRSKKADNAEKAQ
jgi:hypothetical protein